jgi:ParB-like chromosome segregation protein Spo0J
MHIRDRIKELRRVRASDLRPNPRNWRTHPDAQRDVLKGLLAEVGYAGALLARETEDGGLELIDGHLRAETTPEQLVPVLVLDVTADEAAKILATHDPLAGMALADVDQLQALLADVRTESPAVQGLLDGLARGRPASPGTGPPAEVEVPEAWQVVVECQSEEEQRRLYERLSGEGLRCRVLTL